MHKFIAELPDNRHFMDSKKKGDLKKVFDGIVNYVVQCYGMKDMGRRSSQDQGQCS